MSDPTNAFDNYARYLAVYGALISTISLLWQIYQKWARGPRLTVNCSVGMVFAGNGIIGKQLYLSVEVQNRGTETTTITNVALLGYPKGLFGFLGLNKAHRRQAVVNVGSQLGNTVPYEIKVGARFHTLVIQDAELEKWSRDQRLYVGIFHSFSEKATFCRVRPMQSSKLK